MLACTTAIESSDPAYVHETIKYAAVIRTQSTSSITLATTTGCATEIPLTAESMDDYAFQAHVWELMRECAFAKSTVETASAEQPATSVWTLRTPHSSMFGVYLDVLEVKIVADSLLGSQSETDASTVSAATMSVSIYEAYSSVPHTVLFTDKVSIRPCVSVQASDIKKRQEASAPATDAPSEPASGSPSSVPQADVPTVSPSTSPFAEPESVPVAPSPPVVAPTVPVTPPVAPVAPISPAPANTPQSAPAPVTPPVAAPSAPTAPVSPPRAPTSPPRAPTSPPSAPVFPPSGSMPETLGTCQFEGSTTDPLFDIPAAYYGSAGQGVRISPFKAPGEIDQTIVVDLAMRGVYEIYRTTAGCAEPGVAFTANTELAGAVNWVNFSYCDCTRHSRVAEPLPGIFEDQVVIDFNCSRVDPSRFDNFKFDLIYKKPRQSYSLVYPPSQETIGVGFNYSYVYVRFSSLLARIRYLFDLLGHTTARFHHSNFL